MSTTPVPFDHADAGTPESRWLAAPHWDAVAVLDVPAVVRRFPEVLVVSAHPDDETLGVGGLVSDLALAGARVRVLVATSGERSHPVADDRARAALGARRRREVERAVEVLAPGVPVTHLGLPDGGLGECGPTLVEQVGRLCDPATLVLAPWLGDGHADHDALGRACTQAVAATGAGLAHYPVWLWHWGGPDALPWPDAVVAETSPTSSWLKRVALEEFPSQTTPLLEVEGAFEAVVPVLGPAVLARAHRLFETLIDPGHVLPTVPTAARDGAVAGRGETFDRMYDGGDDPWRLAGSFYEDRRRALLLAVLGRRRHHRVLEVGCADGRLTEALVERCDHLVALDTSARAVAAARRRVPSATVHRGAAPGDLPAGPFDLVVLSEVGYFLTPLELVATLRRLEAALAPGGEVVLCHWQHPTRDVPLDGALVHEQAATVLSLPRRVRYADADLRIEVWGGPESVAEREGRT